MRLRHDEHRKILYRVRKAEAGGRLEMCLRRLEYRKVLFPVRAEEAGRRPDLSV